MSTLAQRTLHGSTVMGLGVIAVLSALQMIGVDGRDSRLRDDTQPADSFALSDKVCFNFPKADDDTEQARQAAESQRRLVELGRDSVYFTFGATLLLALMHATHLVRSFGRVGRFVSEWMVPSVAVGIILLIAVVFGAVTLYKRTQLQNDPDERVQENAARQFAEMTTKGGINTVLMLSFLAVLIAGIGVVRSENYFLNLGLLVALYVPLLVAQAFTVLTMDKCVISSNDEAHVLQKENHPDLTAFEGLEILNKLNTMEKHKLYQNTRPTVSKAHLYFPLLPTKIISFVIMGLMGLLFVANIGAVVYIYFTRGADAANDQLSKSALGDRILNSDQVPL
jgi:Ca2+/Na+ antiporter